MTQGIDLQDHCRQPHALPLTARKLINLTVQLIVQTKPGRDIAQTGAIALLLHMQRQVVPHRHGERRGLVLT